MLIYNSTEESFYDSETGLISKVVKESDFKIEDNTLDKICDTAIKLTGFIVIALLGLVLKEYPPPQLFV
jgi:hypothetical protein